VQGDVGDRESVLALRDAVLAGLGAPDIVVTNAVEQIYPWQTVLEESVEDR
jgi:3-oxoacyl-[acyl-carrier protein] reductase